MPSATLHAGLCPYAGRSPALYASQFRPFLERLTACTGRRTVYFQVTSNAAQVEAMRSGRLHIAGFSTGSTAFAVIRERLI